MKEILVISGKGGAGKTSLTAALAKLMSPCVLVDCDVDAADLHLLLQPQVRQTHPFISGVAPVLELSRCSGCGHCYTLCRFQAIRLMTDGKPEFSLIGCEGCGVCADHCPTQAIVMQPQQCGEWYRSDTACGPMIHARLFPGAENSGKLVAAIRQAAKEVALEQGIDIILSDGPPGIGCPVISALTGVDLALLVTEPSVSGIHDMKRTAELTRKFEIDFQVVINKADINLEKTAEIEAFCQRNAIEIAGKINYDQRFTEALRQGRTVMDWPDSASAQEVKAVWKRLCQSVVLQETNVPKKEK